MRNRANMRRTTIRKAFVRSIPVMAGYIVLGIGFGVLMHAAGYGLLWTLAMSLLIYAGSMQYVGVGLLSGGASVVTAILTTVMVNARHLFYSISMIRVYRDSGRLKPYLIFALTDETYSLLCDGDVPEGADAEGDLFVGVPEPGEVALDFLDVELETGLLDDTVTAGGINLYVFHADSVENSLLPLVVVDVLGADDVRGSVQADVDPALEIDCAREVAAHAEGEGAAALFGNEIDGFLDACGVVYEAVALDAEVGGLIFFILCKGANSKQRCKCQCNNFFHIRLNYFLFLNFFTLLVTICFLPLGALSWTICTP